MKHKQLTGISQLKEFEVSLQGIKACMGGSTNEYEQCSKSTDGGNDTERTLYKDGEERCKQTIYVC